MADYTIAKDTENWDVPLNANLTDINNRISVVESTDGTQNSAIASLQGNVSANTANIATNTANIATNATNIATNAANIATNTTNIANVTTTANNAVPKDAQVVNVKDHGAVGDGVTDDTSSINIAVGLLSSGGVLYFPPGNYLLNGSSSITLPGNTSIVGAGPEASALVIGSSNTAGAAVNVTGDFARIQDIEIRGNSSSVSSLPTAFGVQSVNNQQLRIDNVYFKWINNYAVKAWGDTVDTSTGGTTLHGGSIVNSSIVSCAGGVYLKTTNGGSLSSVWPANFQINGLLTRFLGLNAGTNANLDGIRIEDCGDVLVENCFAWMNSGTGGTGSSFRVVGNCAAIFILNLDALGPTTSTSGNVSIEANSNGSPQNVQITGGVIQQGSVGLNIAGASTQVRVGTVRFINNQTHGAVVSTSGPAVYFDAVFFSGNGAGATGTNYDLNWSGTTTGFVTNCRFASPIVAVNNPGVQQSINITAGQNVRFFNADFQGTGAAQANWFTNLPAAAHNVAGGNFSFLTNVDFNYSTGPGRVAIQPFAAGNNCLALNVQGNDANDRFRLTGDGAMNWGTGAAARDTQWGRQGVANIGTTNSDISINLAGKSLKVASGTNAKAGTVTANGTTAVTVSTTAITANSVVVFGLKTQSGTAATTAPFMSAVTAGTSFQIKSSAGDTSVYNWVILDLI